MASDFLFNFFVVRVAVTVVKPQLKLVSHLLNPVNTAETLIKLNGLLSSHGQNQIGFILSKFKD